MKFYLFSLLWLSSHIAFSQIKSRVVDSETKKGIPYVNIWVENQNIGTTSDKNGDFVLHTNDSSIVIIFSSIGYAATRMLVETIKYEVILHPEPGQLEEILVTSEKKERIVGGFKKRKINSYFACYSLP
ncbi:MAG: carboxypeptidase-like regulatory domain-containing protein [Cryomorphaceae bacterium]|nr:carboxypeptidase-like regulatory domain-containing protein [Cryomorphaceae bacterium]